MLLARHGFSISQKSKVPLPLEGQLQPLLMVFLICASLDAMAMISLQGSHELASSHTRLRLLGRPLCLPTLTLCW